MLLIQYAHILAVKRSRSVADFTRSYILLYSALMVYNNFKDCIVGEAMVH